MSLMTAVSKATTLTANAATQVLASSLTRTNIVLQGPTGVFIGGSDVSASNGFPLTAGVPFPVSLDGAQAAIYAFASAAYTVNTLEFKLL